MRPPRQDRAGFTLLEMVVVMAIVVVVSALAIPSIRALLADGRMSAAGDQVRARLADGRALAMEQGRPFKVAFVANTGHVQIGPEDDACWDAVDPKAVDTEEVLHGELPEAIHFRTSPSNEAADSASADGGWVTAAIYLPDGSARDDVTFYYGPAAFQPMGVQVRGLTGAVTLFDPAKAEKEPQ